MKQPDSVSKKRNLKLNPKENGNHKNLSSKAKVPDSTINEVKTKKRK